MTLMTAAASAAPCTTATESCTEWVTLAGGPSRSLVYRTYPLNARNETITRAFILVHGAGRDANNYFRTAVAAAFLAGGLDDTVVVAPRLASNDADCRDTLAPNEVSWPCNGNSWRAGGIAKGSQTLTSFDFADEILRRLADKQAFPNLKTIVVAGHSAGGQFVTRYEMANRIHDTLGVPITYVVANPSSYAYLDAVRPNALAYAPTASAPGYIPAPPANAPATAGGSAAANSGAFRTFGDERNCTTFNQWPYGLQKRTGYTEKLTDEQLKKQLVARPTTYLLGELDILPLGGFDASCPAMAQGPTRLARGQAFGKYVNEKLGAQHQIVVVPLCGHNARCMFTSDAALPLVFPKP
jgi:pimeloyl-ACP methyl ester carboxylesterase